MIKAIIFDLGNVIYRTNWDGLNKMFRKKFGFDIRLLKDKRVYKIFKDAKIGKASTKDVAVYLGHTDKVKEILKYYKKCCFDNKILNKGMIKIIKKLRNKYPIYVMTDTNKEHYESDKEGGLFDLFEKVFSSHDMGKLKTDKSFFEDITKGIGFSPEELLFIDDRLENIENAKEIGMKTIHYTDFPKIAKFKEKLKNALNNNFR